jgi:subtilisin family serine protease
MRNITFALALACMALPLSASGATPGPGGPKNLHLLTGEAFDPATTRVTPAPESDPASTVVVVQFRERVPASLADSSFDLDARTLTYLPDDALVVRASSSEAKALANHPDVRWVGPYDKAWRLSPEIAREQARLFASTEEPLNLELALWRGSKDDRVLQLLDQLGAEDVRERSADAGNTRILFRLPAGKLDALAQLDDISWIEPAPTLTRRNTTSSWVLQSNSNGVTPVWNRGLHGEGEIIGHIDGEVDLNSCFFRDSVSNVPGPSHRKVVAYFDPIDSEAHGTHTAGTLVGKRVNGSLTNAGIAYEARIAHALDLNIEGFLNTPSTLKAAFLRAQEVEAWIHSNSWGDDNRTSYTFWCLDIDEYLWENEDAVVVFATSNLSSLKSPENAKNCISVAGSDSPPFQETVYTGGSGPTYDGRRKPDVVALGRNVVSARYSTDCSTLTASGTSMAAPAVAASAALVRQYFREGFYPNGYGTPEDGFIPSGPLIKAVLLNGTADMTMHAGFPGNREGWGRLLLDRSLYFEGDTRTLLLGEQRHAQGISTSEVFEFNFDVDAINEPLFVTLTWYDPPAAHAAATAWINNLNLEVISPSDALYRGNVFSGGLSATGGTADAINNVEQVRLVTPQVGEWTLRIVGQNVPIGPQGFAWAISGAVSATSTVPSNTNDFLRID